MLLPPAASSLAALLLVTLVCAPGAAYAQADPGKADEAPDLDGRVEVGIHAGRRFGGLVRVPGVDLPLDLEDDAAWMVEAGWRISPHLAAGAFVSRQRTRLGNRAAGTEVASTELELQHLALWFRPGAGSVRPEIGISVGRTRFGLDEGGGDHHASMGFALGARARIAGPLELVARGQFFTTLLGGSSRILCGGPAAPCLRTSNDTVLLQLQASAGLAVRF